MAADARAVWGPHHMCQPAFWAEPHSGVGAGAPSWPCRFRPTLSLHLPLQVRAIPSLGSAPPYTESGVTPDHPRTPRPFPAPGGSRPHVALCPRSLCCGPEGLRGGVSLESSGRQSRGRAGQEPKRGRSCGAPG